MAALTVERAFLDAYWVGGGGRARNDSPVGRAMAALLVERSLPHPAFLDAYWASQISN